MILMLKQPKGTYPAYNDSLLTFWSTLKNVQRAEIVVTPSTISNYTFVLYPQPNVSAFRFNLKNMAMALFSSFIYAHENETSGIFDNFMASTATLTVDIKVIATDGEDFGQYTYNFFRGVSQVGEKVSYQHNQVTVPASSPFDYNVKYWRGFPFAFSTLTAANDEIYKVLNKGTSRSLEFTVGRPNEVVGVNFQVDAGGGEDWTSKNQLPLIDGVSILELYRDGDFFANVHVDTVYEPCGVLLRWANSRGDVSYWLFNKESTTDYDFESIGTVMATDFDNIDDDKGDSISLGKQGEKTVILRTEFEHVYDQLMIDLVSSPSVQMYTSETAYQLGKWINVTVDANLSLAQKLNKNKISISVQLPPLNTMLK